MNPVNSGIYDEIYVKFSAKIRISYVVGWLIVTLIEAIFAIVLKLRGELVDVVYVLKYLVLPAGVDLILIMITLAVMSSERIKTQVKNILVISSMVLIAYVLATVHSYYLASVAFFLTPVLVSTAFLDKKNMWLAAGLSIVACILCVPVCPFFDVTQSTELRWVNAGLIVILIIMYSLIASVIMNLHLDREKVLIEIQAENAKLSKQTKIDGLTGLQNHTSFYTLFEYKLMKARHDKNLFSISIIDIDDFKTINDTYGHGVGDEVLRYVSQTIQSIIGQNGTVFRYGGDEFTVVFSNPDAQGNAKLLERLRQTVSSNKEIITGGVGVTLSIGYYNVKEFSMSAEDIFFKADQALYQAKYSGKNQVISEI